MKRLLRQLLRGHPADPTLDLFALAAWTSDPLPANFMVVQNPDGSISCSVDGVVRRW